LRSKQVYIKRAIEASFLRLLGEQSFEKITVKSIVDDCGLTRNTFYNYFEDTYDLVDGLLRSLVCDVANSAEAPTTLVAAMRPVTQFAKEHPRAVKHLYRSTKREELMGCFDKMFELMVTRLVDASYRDGRLKTDDRELVINALRFVISGFFKQWIDSGMNESLEETLEQLEKLLPLKDSE
jgi:AcrR family transcriptional regulator